MKLKLFIVLLFISCLPKLSFSDFTKWDMPEDWDLAKWHWVDLDKDGSSELILQGRRKFRIWFATNKSYPKDPLISFEIPEPFAFYEITELEKGKQAELFLMAPDNIQRLKINRENFKLIFEKVTSIKAKIQVHPQRLNHLNFLIDLDGDGKKEIHYPDSSGHKFLSSKNGKWKELVSLGSSMEPKLTFHSYTEQFRVMGPFSGDGGMSRRFFPQRSGTQIFRQVMRWPHDSIRVLDINRDERLDLADSKRQSFQNSKGEFETVVQEKKDKKNPKEDEFATRDFEKLLVMIDINGDGWKDEFVVRRDGEFILPKTKISVKINPGKMMKPEDFELLKANSLRTTAIVPGIDARSVLIDIDKDGDLDLVLVKLNHNATSRNSLLKAFMQRGIKANIQFHFWSDKSGFAKRPQFTFPIVVKQGVYGLPEMENSPFTLGHDFNGDGKTDLVLKDQSDRLSIHRLIDAKKGFEKKPWHSIKTPFEIAWFKILDISRDKKADLMITLRDKKKPLFRPSSVYISK